MKHENADSLANTLRELWQVEQNISIINKDIFETKRKLWIAKDEYRTETTLWMRDNSKSLREGSWMIPTDTLMQAYNKVYEAQDLLSAMKIRLDINQKAQERLKEDLGL